jgi:branched-chain amino acid transport system permease protein
MNEHADPSDPASGGPDDSSSRTVRSKPIHRIFWYPALLFCLIVLPLVFSGPFSLHTFILIMMNIILASSLRLISLSGQMSLAHGSMATIGAYVSTLLVMKLGFSTWVALLCGGLSAALVAALVGIPFVRLKGIYFSIVTIFFGEMIILTAEQWESLTGGTGGIFNIPRPDPIPFFHFASKTDFYYLALFLMVLSLVVLYAIEHSRIGLTFRGIRQTDSLCESVGINARGFKILAFSGGCFFAGIVGAFHSQYISAINPDGFSFLFTIYILVYMTVGGAESFSGPILGALVLTLLPEVTRVFKEYVPFFFAAVLIAVIFFMPEGIVGLGSRIRKVARR